MLAAIMTFQQASEVKTPSTFHINPLPVSAKMSYRRKTYIATVARHLVENSGKAALAAALVVFCVFFFAEEARLGRQRVNER